MEKRAIDPDPGTTPKSISQAIKVGNTVYVSGQVAVDSDGVVVGTGDPRVQAVQCFRNLESVLAAAGAKMSDVVKLTNYFVDAAHFPAYRDVKMGVFPVVPPASTGVIVAGLLDPRFLIEIEAIAVIQD